MKAFLSSLSRSKRYVVAELFLVYFAHGLSSIMLGSVLPDLRAAYALDYQIGGTLLSAQSIGYLGIGLLSGLAAIKWGLKRAYLILYYVFAVGFVMLLTNGSPVWLLAAMFLTGISKGAITDYNNRVMSEYANGSATPLNMMHAAYAFGACVAPLAVLACHKLGGDNGWRLALEISIVLLTASFIFGLFMKMDDDKSTKTEQKSATDYGFFREKLFWLCTALCFFYEAVEASMMGWLTSSVTSDVVPSSFVTVRVTCTMLKSYQTYSSSVPSFAMLRAASVMSSQLAGSFSSEPNGSFSTFKISPRWVVMVCVPSSFSVTTSAGATVKRMS